MSGVNEAVIKRTQETLGKFVKRPPLTEKLLLKPPFRFLHDVINVVIKETGFLKGLYTAEELNSENIKDRDAKIKFLEKLINIVAVVTKAELKVRPSKIVAGQEPERTNELLQAIGMAIERKLDSRQAIEAAKAGNAPAKKTSKTPAATQKTKPSPTTTVATKGSKSVGKVEKATEKRAKPADTEKKPKAEAKVAKPVTKKENLIVKNEKNKKDQDKKRIDSGIKLEDSPNEQETNREDSPKGIQLTLEATPQIDQVPTEKVVEEPVKVVEEKPEVKPENPVQEVRKERDELVDVIDEEAERRRNEKRPPKSAEEVEVPQPEEPESRSESHQRKRTKSSEKKVKKVKEERKPLTKQASVDGSGKIQNVPRPRTSLRPPSVRPASARPGAPRRRDKNVEIVLQPEEMVKMGDISVKMENFSVDLEDDGENLIIIEDSTQRDDPMPSPAALEGVDAGQEHGHLVQQILETQKGLTGGKGASEEEKKDEWSDRRTRQTSTQQMDALRDSIQKLTRAVNPLGKLMNFLQEDIDSMQREFNMWREMHQMALNELNRERSHSQPATEALKSLEASIQEHIELIDISRGNILHNEQKIAKLLTDT
ncbi:TRAF3-interacting protein 1 [Phlebotomus argentipes]|uniref:TRAF3-interacting protein 1 n=1 Tax=Phlebotomus argentipes TaxID=94469 RepID=UPI002892C311|nr:TRAF3-interacting protein 1 [Phlebotomus argentipes]